MLCTPRNRELQNYRRPDSHGLWEAAASRLARCCTDLGAADIADPVNWSLQLTNTETKLAHKFLSFWPGAESFAAFSLGAKIDIKSWGDDRWANLLKELSGRHPALGLALIGGPNDREQSDKVAQGWQGPVLNLCGQVEPRISASVIDRARFFMGHDSGPMHLAASVGTPSVSVFSNRAKPGIWFPFGAQNRVFYPGLAWSGGTEPIFRDAAGEANITLIPIAPVLEACDTLLEREVSGQPK